MIVLGLAAAAAIGAALRAVATDLDGSFSRQLYGTAAVNVAGSFLLGWLASSGSPNTLIVAGVGGMGALTTFSTFVSQLESIFRKGRASHALLYAVASLTLGILAAYAGWNL